MKAKELRDLLEDCDDDTQLALGSILNLAGGLGAAVHVKKIKLTKVDDIIVIHPSDKEDDSDILQKTKTGFITNFSE
jgi:hypothetical protein